MNQNSDNWIIFLSWSKSLIFPRTKVEKHTPAAARSRGIFSNNIRSLNTLGAFSFNYFSARTIASALFSRLLAIKTSDMLLNKITKNKEIGTGKIPSGC